MSVDILPSRRRRRVRVAPPRLLVPHQRDIFPAVEISWASPPHNDGAGLDLGNSNPVS